MTDGKIRGLSLTALVEGAPGLTPQFGACLGEAAAVCLEEQGHSVGVVFVVDGDCTERFVLDWQTIDEQTQKCWADSEVATEHGAYGLAIMLAQELDDLTVLERSRKGTGFDFWLGPIGSKEPLFQEKVRLEVSGIRNGRRSAISRRLREKLAQIQQSHRLGLEAVVVVVEFSAPQARMVKS